MTFEFFSVKKEAELLTYLYPWTEQPRTIASQPLYQLLQGANKVVGWRG